MQKDVRTLTFCQLMGCPSNHYKLFTLSRAQQTATERCGAKRSIRACGIRSFGEWVRAQPAQAQLERVWLAVLKFIKCHAGRVRFFHLMLPVMPTLGYKRKKGGRRKGCYVRPRCTGTLEPHAFLVPMFSRDVVILRKNMS